MCESQSVLFSATSTVKWCCLSLQPPKLGTIKPEAWVSQESVDLCPPLKRESSDLMLSEMRMKKLILCNISLCLKSCGA